MSQHRNEAAVQMPLEVPSQKDSLRSEIARRSFFKKVATAAASLTLAEVALACATSAAQEEMTQTGSTFCQGIEPFPGACLTLWAFGHKTCHQLYTGKLKDLVPEVQRRIINAPDGMVTASDAAQIISILEDAKDLSPETTIRQIYLMDQNNIANYEQLVAKLQSIDVQIFPLAFAFQEARFVADATIALRESDTESMIDSANHREKTYQSLYTERHPGNDSYSKIRAISRGKKGNLFGLHGSAFSTAAEYDAFLANFNGPTKSNNRACNTDHCSPCIGRYCSEEASGFCSQMSDLYDSNCLR
ncbi:MAG TPA: hypothetical protein PLJ47_01760 [Candidatus Hydrogenedentes bacterium]|nr:hypothetical protein [Candidatus Hydrogenedentota bacterium]